MKIGIDIMGGDDTPKVTVLGAIAAKKELPSGVELVLIGDKKAIEEVFEQEKVSSSSFTIIPSKEDILMGEHPAKAYAKKQQSSIAVGYNLLAKKEIDGFASAGNTGAMLVGAMYTVKVIPGIIRPSICTSMPKYNGNHAILLDIGLNPDVKPDVLYQYAIIGSIYCESVHKMKNPRVGLLNIGSEEEKGNLLTKASFEAMKGTKDFNFIGNVEGTDFFSDEKVDVIVCDGFTGNVVLKTAESFYTVIKNRNINDEFLEKFNPEQYGGTPILGINANVVIGHGASNVVAIKNMILHTKEVIDANLSERIKEAFKR